MAPSVRPIKWRSTAPPPRSPTPSSGWCEMTLPSLSVQQTGVGVVSADNYNTYVQSGGSTINNLKSFVGITGIILYVTGTSTISDGGQGFFYWNPSWTGSPDNVNTVQPANVVTGAWIRIPFVITSGSNFPTTNPGAGTGLLWNNGGFICVA